VANLHLAGFNNVKIDIRVTDPKNDVAVGVVARFCKRFDEREFGVGKPRKGGLFRPSHCIIPNAANMYLTN
jgi:hypothetical protein